MIHLTLQNIVIEFDVLSKHSQFFFYLQSLPKRMGCKFLHLSLTCHVSELSDRDEEVCVVDRCQQVADDRVR